jgi:hypothetical protein
MARRISEAEVLQQVRDNLSKRRGTLTAEQAAALDDFALNGGQVERISRAGLLRQQPVDATVKCMAGIGRGWLSIQERDACILRYLRAHRNHVVQAATGIIATVRWRLQSNIGAINPHKFMHLLSDGRMVCCCCAGRVNVFVDG